ncbi:MAG: adenylosuccinate lyase [Candidatus Enteromonas sp.]|nr:adenylosuccinate lyase [Mollicutes bacterium]MDY4935733.1 adenylosuccinate lyase [Candidatus Enteromonas sp.]
MISRYNVKEIEDIFSLENRYKTFLEIELASLEAHVQLGIVPKEDYLKIKEKAHIDLDRINELEAIHKHDVIAFTRSIGEQLGEEKRWFHYGLTSTDVVDSALSLNYAKAYQIIDKDIDALLETYREKAIEYKNLPCIARTHGMHAEITSFGLKFVRFYDELRRNKERLKKAKEELCLIKLEGSIGTFSFLDPRVETFVASKFNLNYPSFATQIIARDNHTNFLSVLALIAEEINNAAMELRNLARNEINEVNEYFSSNQKGSSAMPHKHNPISLENICGLSRLEKGYALSSYENIPLFHERDISHSSNERIIFPEAFITLSYILRRMNRTVSKLIVNKENIQKNIDLTYGIIYSQRVLTALVEKGLSREKSYDLVQSLALSSYNNKTEFKEILKNNKEIMDIFSQEEIDELFDPKFYFRNIDYIYSRCKI